MILHAASTIIFEIVQFKSLCVILFFSTFAVPPPLHITLGSHFMML